MSIKKHTIDFVLYSVSTLISKAVPLLLILVLSHYFKPSEYGVLSLVQAAIFVFTFFLGGEFVTGVSRRYFVVSKKNFSLCLSTSMCTILLFGILTLMLVSVYEIFIGSILSMNLILCVLAVLCAITQSILLILTTTLQMAEKPWRYLWIQVVYSLSFLICVMSMYFGNTLTVTSFFLLQSIASIIGILFNMKSLSGIVDFEFNINKQELSYLLVYSAPLVIYSVASFFVVMYLRFTVKDIGGLYMLGLFTVAQQMGMLMSNADFIVIKVWTPYAFKLLAQDNIKKFFISSYKPVLLLVTLFVILLIVNKLAFYFIISQKYRSAYACSLIVLLAFLMKSIYSVFVTYAYFFKKTIYVAVINAVIAIMSFTFAKYFIVNFGLIGGGVSMFLSYLTLMLMSFTYILFDCKVRISKGPQLIMAK